MRQAVVKDAVEGFNPAVSVFVSANAGAGKTSLLARRVLSLLLSEPDPKPSRILCLTFTKAAAAEMAARVQGELGSWVMMEEKALADRIETLMGYAPDGKLIQHARELFARVLEDAEGIRIQTIHSFCQSLLARFPLEAGISPHFAVIEPQSAQTMLREARLRLFTNAQSQGDAKLKEAIASLARAVSETTLHDLLDTVIAFKKRFRILSGAPGGMGAAIDALWQLTGLTPETTRSDLWGRHFAYQDTELAQLRAVAAQLAQGAATDIKMSEGLARWLPKPDASLLEEYLPLFLTQTGSRRKQLCTKSGLSDDELKECLQAEQERVAAFDEAVKSLGVAQASAALLTIADALLAQYDTLKAAQAGMDYDDLIVMACDLLRRPGVSEWVLYKLDDGIHHVLVDEAQDTSPEQWSIIDLLTREFFAGSGAVDAPRSLFIVGDEKQSIFSFQGADVRELGKMQQHFHERIKASAATVQWMELTRSYRSTREILSAVDAVFAQAEARSGLTFSGAEIKHIPTRLEAPGLVELWPLIRPEGGTHQSLRLVRTIADTIAGWLRQGLWLEAKNRSLNAGDIMVLVRSRGVFVDQLSRALKRRHVPVAGIDRMALADNLAVQDLVALGQCVLLPEDDLSLAGLLKSPLCGLNEDALFALAYRREKKSLWQRLQEREGEEPFATAYKLLADLRSRADFMRPYELYAHALDTLGARRRFTGRMGGEYSDAIDEFLNQTLLYERSHTPSLQGFLHWFLNSESEVKRDMEQARDCVRIMTVHGAKGLQAPVVILPDTIEPPKLRDVLFWDETGLPLWPRNKAGDNARIRALRESETRDMYAEYRRLLYVALTRAEDHLYILGATHAKDAGEESWYRYVQNGLAPIAQAITTPEGTLYRLGKEATAKAKPAGKTAPASMHSFAFLSEPPAAEPIPPKPLSPSRLPGDEPASASPLESVQVFERGLFIHKLLQFLPALPDAKREAAARRLAAGSRGTMKPDEIATCITEALAVMRDPAFAFLFSEGSMAEVPIAGTVQVAGKPVAVAGQIDRLHAGEKEVWIVDYKTNKAPPERMADMPLAYRRQLLLYQKLVREIYPLKTVRCALLWTAVPRIDALPEALLDEGAINTYI